MHDPREHALVCKALRDGLGGCVEWDEAGLVKSWSCTSCAFIPISLRPFPPLAKGGLGGWARHDQSQGLPMLCPSQSFRIPLARREESFSLSKARAAPPLPPLRKGGKGIARSRRHSIPRNKNTRLEIVPPALSTPTFHRPSGRVCTTHQTILMNLCIRC